MIRAVALAVFPMLMAGAAMAQDDYALAMERMVAEISAEDLDLETNRKVMACYLDLMDEGQLAAIAHSTGADMMFEVLVGLPMDGVECEAAVTSDFLGVEVNTL